MTAPWPEVQHTLAAVEARVGEVVDALDADWHSVATQPADVLGSEDLPALVRGAAIGGKRLRPQMVHWGWIASGRHPEAWRQVVELGAALELLHVFALVHDDVMDASLVRRGNPSVHAAATQCHRSSPGTHGDAGQFGEHIAILVGDLLHAEADHLVATLPHPVRQVWRTMMIELVLGQRRDLTGAALGRRDLAQAREVARLKSGSYTVQRPLQMGALLGGADPAQIDCLMRYGGHVGEAFGLRDDLLGTWGDPGTTGKSAHDDLESGKPTVLLALADERLPPAQRALLARTGSGGLAPEELQELRLTMDACGIRDEVEALIEHQTVLACQALDPDIVAPAAVEGLHALADQIAWRNS